ITHTQFFKVLKPSYMQKKLTFITKLASFALTQIILFIFN
ncbi:hypothetical protein A5872_002616, partial [Enterococcus faecium]